MRRAEHAADAKLQRRRGGRLKTESVPGVVFAASVAHRRNRLVDRVSGRDGIDVIYGNDNHGDFTAARDPVS
jgi:hypothetical protein